MRLLLLPCLALAVLLSACALPVPPTPIPPDETPVPTPTRVIGRPTATPVPVVITSLPPTRGPLPGGPTFIAPFGTPVIGVAGTPLPELPNTSTPTPTATWTPRPPPTLTIEPARVPPGARVVVRGSNWVPGQGVFITLGPTVAEAVDHITTAVVLSDGHFETAFFLPDRWSRQPSLVLRARNFDSSFQANTTFTIIAPSPTATIIGWYGEYFNNRELQGKPILVRDDKVIDFNWGPGAPAMGIPVDDFSVRWSGTIDIAEGLYEFNILADDGVRLFVDEKLLINEWHMAAARTYTKEANLSSGKHRIRLEYFEATGSALIKLDWKPSVRDRGWDGEYYNTTDLSQDPVLRRFDPDLDFDWRGQGPGSPVYGENFSAYWTRRPSFEAGRYGFYAEADDGVRVWINRDDSREKLIDEWHGAEPATYFRDVIFPKAGRFAVDVAFLQLLGDAKLHVWWERLTDCVSDCPDWIGEYYDNPGWRGQPAFRRNDGAIDFAWRDDRPDDRIKSDHYSVRWTRAVTFQPGTYRFSITANGDVRMWMDDVKVFDTATGQPPVFPKNYARETTVRLRVEYIGVRGGAQIKVDWNLAEMTP